MTKIFVLGGVRSGKSSYAATVAESLSGDEGVTLIATADSASADSGMRQRIEKHRAERPAHWTTLEAPIELDLSLEEVTHNVVVIDCLTIWLSNLLATCGDADQSGFYMLAENTIQSALRNLVAATERASGHLIIVANDVGSGVAPLTRLGNVFADMQGLVNQRIAAVSDEVYVMTAGIPTRIK